MEIKEIYEKVYYYKPNDASVLKNINSFLSDIASLSYDINLVEPLKDPKDFNIDTYKRYVLPYIENYKTTNNINVDIDIKSYNLTTKDNNNFGKLENTFNKKYCAILYLNDDYVGGQISFANNDANIDLQVHPNYPQNKELVKCWIKPRILSMLIFPLDQEISYFQHKITARNQFSVEYYF